LVEHRWRGVDGQNFPGLEIADPRPGAGGCGPGGRWRMADASANRLAIIIIVIVIVVIVCTGNPDRVEKTGTRPYRTEAKTDCQP
jgi:hypothetical protein